MLEEILLSNDFNFNNYTFLKRELSSLTEDDKRKIQIILNNFRKDYYDSKYIEVLRTFNCVKYINYYNPSKYIHGVYHVERVFLYCYLLVKKSNMSKEAIIDDDLASALYYAALYHDMGRLDNRDDFSHGANSAIAFYKLFKEEELFKRKPEYMTLVQFLITAHSLGDKCSINDVFNILDNQICCFNVNQKMDEEVLSIVLNLKEEYEILLKILKDSDALDRKRFGDWTRESLNDDFLRLSFSKELTGLSDELNKIYYKLIKANYPQINIDQIYSQLLEKKYTNQNSEYCLNGCFHSICFDFFKLKSIIYNGILSYDAAKKRDILFTKNFPGGNFDRWVSVVSDKLYSNAFSRNRDRFENYASEEFTNHGITFYCEDVVMRKPIEDKDLALEKGLPWNRSNYKDELYVYDLIPSEKISCILVPFNYINLTLENLRYIYESTNMDIINDRINYYLKCTRKILSEEEDFILTNLLKQYLQLIVTELSKSYEDGNKKEYRDASYKKMSEINSIVSGWVIEYYSKILCKSNPTVKDVIEYEISNLKDIRFVEVEDNSNLDKLIDREKIFIKKIL